MQRRYEEDEIVVETDGNVVSIATYLTSVGIRPSIGHRKDSFSFMLKTEVFVGEFLTVNGFAFVV